MYTFTGGCTPFTQADTDTVWVHDPFPALHQICQATNASLVPQQASHSARTDYTAGPALTIHGLL